MSQFFGVSFDPGWSGDSKKVQVEEPLMDNDEAQFGGKRKSQSLMGSIREFVLGEQFEGGGQGGGSDGSSTPPTSRKGFAQGVDSHNQYEDGAKAQMADAGDDDRSQSRASLQGFFGYQDQGSNDDEYEGSEQSEESERSSVGKNEELIKRQTAIYRRSTKGHETLKNINLHTYESHCVLEPSNKEQWLEMIGMNAFEVIFVILIGSLAIYQASWTTSIIYFISGYQLKAAKKFATTRLSDRKRNCKVVCVLVFLIIAFKILIMCFVNKKGIMKEDGKQQDIAFAVRYIKSIGISCSLDKQDEIKYEYFMTFLFEICMIAIVIVYYWLTIRLERSILYLSNHAKEVNRLQEYEKEQQELKKQDEKKDKQAEDDEDDEFEQFERDNVEQIEKKGKSTINLARISEAQTLKEESDESQEIVYKYNKQKHEETLQDIEQMKKKLDDHRNFIECKKFKKSNKILYISVLVSTVFQAMMFNSMIDITSLFLILVVQSFYSYREYYKTTYQRLIFFTCYWLQLVTQLKIQFVIQMYIPQINYWFVHQLDNKWVSLVKSLFGLDFIVDHKRDFGQECIVLLYYLTLFICLFSSQMWKQSKWSQIRDTWIKEYQDKIKRKVIVNKNKGKNNAEADKYGSSFQMFDYYVIYKTHFKNEKNRNEKNRVQEEIRLKIQQKFDKMSDKEKEDDKLMSDKQREQQLANWKTRYQLKKFEIDQLLPTVFLWSARILVVFQSYMYHNTYSQINLIWAILTFLISNQLSLFISILFMIPLYLLEFTVVYSKQIPYLTKTMDYYFISTGYFTWQLQAPILEQILFYVILTIFVMMISALKASLFLEQVDHGGDKYFLNFYKKKLISQHTSILWKFTLWPLRRIHIIIFIILFVVATNNMSKLDHFMNLGFIFFVSAYITFDRVYRKTGIVLLIFMSWFIISSYYYSLNYHIIEINPKTKKSCEWWGMWSSDNNPDWKHGSSVYFRCAPSAKIWILLIVFKQLNVINVLFSDQGEVAKLETKCYQQLRQTYPIVVSYFNNGKNLIQNFIIYVYIGIMLLFLTDLQLNLFSFIMVTQNIIMIALVCKQEKSESNLKLQLLLVQCMKFYACLVIMLDTSYMSFQTIFDHLLEKKAPKFYRNLNFIGLRAQNIDGEHSKKYIDNSTRQKFYQYVAYLIMSILLHSYFQSAMASFRSQENWKEEDYKKLYEYQVQNVEKKKKKLTKAKKQEIEKLEKQKSQQEFQEKLAKAKSAKQGTVIFKDDPNLDSVDESSQIQDDESFFDQKNIEFHSPESDHDLKCQNELVNIETMKKKNIYTTYDLKDRYHFRRWQVAYLVYKSIDWWPVFDAIASQSHVFNGFLIIYVALYKNVSFFMFIYVLSVAFYYIFAIRKLQKSANDISYFMSLGTQIDLYEASSICKIYNTKSNWQFHKIRLYIWRFQLALLSIIAIMSFPTGIISLLRMRCLHDKTCQPEYLDKLDKSAYWLFIIGIYQGQNAEEKSQHINAICILFVGLFLERSAINWLKNRWGCDYFYFQKFIELETRYKSIKEKWEVQPIPFRPDHYAYHNFYKVHDFQDILPRFWQQGQNEITEEFTQEFKDFIPYKAGKRIQQVIQFSLRIDGRDPSLMNGSIDKNTDVKLTSLFNKIQVDLVKKEQLKVIEQKVVKLSQEIKDKKEEDCEEQKKKLKNEAKKLEEIQDDLSRLHIVDAYEDIDVLKDYKQHMLEDILKQAMTMKYKISFSKGMMFVFENIIMLILLTSIALKSNVFSLIYLIFVFRYPFCKHKHQLFARMCFYISISLAVQYLLYLLNMTSYSFPQGFPSFFDGFPFKQLQKDPDYLQKKNFPFPIFFQLKNWIGEKHFLYFCYFMGIGINQSQLENLLLDFFNLFLVASYILYFRNPIFCLDMKKVFWLMPLPTNDPKQWNRLDDQTKKKKLFSLNPVLLSDKQFDTLRKDHNIDSEKDKELSQERVDLLKKNLKRYFSLDNILVNYIDLKYNEIWSKSFMKKIKKQMKEQNLFYRIVKEGSQVVYLTQHINAIAGILLLSIIRQSLVSIIYMIVIVWKIIFQSEDALKQKSQNLKDEIDEAEDDIHQKQHLLKRKIDTADRDETHTQSLDDEKEINELKLEIEDLQEKLRRDKFHQWDASKEHHGLINKIQNSDKGKLKDKNISSVNTIEWQFKYTLQIVCILDFTSQIICQMPIVEFSSFFSVFGFRKIWDSQNGDAFKYSAFMDDKSKYQGLQLERRSFILQLFNCFMICYVFLQVAIYDSPGYVKFIKAKNGDLNNMLQLAIMKGKSIAYRFNNKKIMQIIHIKKKKQQVLDNFDQLRDKLKNWRMMKKMTNEDGINKIISQQINEKEMHDNEHVDMNVTNNYIQNSMVENDKPSDRKKTLVPRKKSFDLQRLSHVSIAEASDEDSLHEQEQESSSEDDSFEELIPTKQQKEQFLRRMSKIMVEQKIKKINCLVDIYQYINKNYVEQICFKSRKLEVEELLLDHSKGGIQIPTELETLMIDETEEFITQQFEAKNKNSFQVLNKIVSKFIRMEESTHENLDYQMIIMIQNKLSDDIRLKLKDMTRSWEFTRPCSMITRICATFTYMTISKMQYVIYACMIYSLYENAGLITIIYPFMIFGWALLEETRPTPQFWRVLKVWTTIVLFIKFFYNIHWDKIAKHAETTESQFVNIHIKVVENLFNHIKAHVSDRFSFAQGYLKLGLFRKQDLGSMILYIIPEVIILCLLMINSIQLRLIGFKNQSELDIENVTEGIERVLEKGDIEKVAENQVLCQNMNLYHYFQSSKTQFKQQESDNQLEQEANTRLQEEYKYENDQIGNVGANTQRMTQMAKSEMRKLGQNKDDKRDERAKEQEVSIRLISDGIKQATRHFKMDKFSYTSLCAHNLIKIKALSKTLEDDNLLFTEGVKQDNNPDFIPLQETNQDYLDLIALETFSGGDNAVEFQQKSNTLKLRNAPEFGMFEKGYFNRIFPSLKIQKPGYDLYGATNVFLAVLIVITFTSYSSFNVSYSEVLPKKDNTSNIFSDGMIMMVLFIIFVMVMERFTNRTSTKPPEENQGLEGNEDIDQEERNFFDDVPSLLLSDETLKQKKKVTRWNRNDEFKKNPYDTIKLSNDKYLVYLRELKEKQLNLKSRIPIQQKIKYIMHICLLLFIHVYVFWYVPITGNLKLYGTPICNQQKLKEYGCKDFHENPWLKIYYLILLTYLFLSAMQIKYGLPLNKKSSSVLQYDNNLFWYCLANVYQALPFMVEIRCLIDFSFAKTSLDIFQFWQIYQANFDMYNGKNGNIYYFLKPIGAPMPFIDRCLMGFTFSVLVLGILCGPLVLFSPMGGFIAANPVMSGDINISFLITKSISNQTMEKYLTGQENALEQYSSLNLESIQEKKDDKAYEKELCKDAKGKFNGCSKNYFGIYKNINPEFRTLDEKQFKETKIYDWTESRFFHPDQIQICLAEDYSQTKWLMSKQKQTRMKELISIALDDSEDFHHLHLSIESKFNRKNPPGNAKVASLVQLKVLNSNQYHDCKTKQQLLEFTKFDCTGKEKQFTIIYHQAYTPYVILGDTAKAETLTRKSKENHMVQEYQHNLNLTYYCNSNEWDIQASLNSSKQSPQRNKAMEVHNDTCEPLNQEAFDKERKQHSNEKDVVNSRVYFMLFSMLVSSSFLASYSLTGFYLGVVYVLGTTIRVMIIWPSYKAWMWEAVETDAILRLIDYINLRRYDEDLAGEEEGYRLLREILHCPEFFKSVCGSCLRGTLDPNQDFLSKEDQKKIDQIQVLEKKGFIVKKLKNEILEKAEDKLLQKKTDIEIAEKQKHEQKQEELDEHNTSNMFDENQ